MYPFYVTIVGSRLYNIHKETSDTDIKGVAFASIDTYLGLNSIDQKDYSNNKEGKDNYNGTIYELKRIFHLLIKGNPTVLEPFCVDSKYVIHSSDIGELIAKFVRTHMLTKHFFLPYFGYHHSQIKEFTNSNRIGKRKEEFEKYGMDCKFSAHAYRLAKQCVMIMQTGKLNPTLEGKDKEIVMKMRNHEYTKEECLNLLNNNVVEMDNAFKNSTLPDKPDFNLISSFITSVLFEYVNGKYKYDIKPFDILKFPL